MGILGLLVSLLAGLFLLIGLIPFLGWLNWFTTLPTAVLAIILSGLGLARRPKSGIALAGLTIGFCVAVISLIRLSIGWGIL